VLSEDDKGRARAVLLSHGCPVLDACGAAAELRRSVAACLGAARPRRAIAELREMASGGNDILAEAAGVTAGAWHAAPLMHVGIELLVAGMLIMAGGYDGKPLDYGSFARQMLWVGSTNPAARHGASSARQVPQGAHRSLTNRSRAYAEGCLPPELRPAPSSAFPLYLDAGRWGEVVTLDQIG
jgi:hypothetical protein